MSDTVLAYARNIDNIEALLPAVACAAHKHVSLGVQPKHYDAIGETLLAAIQQVLSLPDDHPALAAWGEACGVLANVFINAEAAIMKDNGQGDGGWDKSQPKHIFLAGGVGITPLMSMMEEATDGGACVDDLLFIQCAKDEDHQIFHQGLIDLKSNAGFNHKTCFENSSEGDHQGYLSKKVLAEWTQTLGFSPDNSQVYLWAQAIYGSVESVLQ